ncbi:helix-turn-helix transcriptional regulator [uncultured Lactobacillus sp.]|uniref:helix-turn-helix transcriptional regulator n=1 Tax=uncultured Lactobacillus sp. TaxID=153152 RepID=UPI002588B599|nr:helix-turn-helix transcriptional regulator [uncultured Lactobacillus sp.]
MKNRIKELRTAHKLSQQDIAEAVGLTRQAVALYESGEREPKLEVWQKLADYLGSSVPYLLGLEDEFDSEWTIKQLEKRNTQLIKDNVALIKEIAFLVGKYPGAAAELAHFNREQKITNGFESQLEDFLEGEG